MNPNYSSAREVFDACLDLATAEEREALLNKLGENSPTLAHTAAGLLIAHDEAEGGGFFSADPNWYYDTQVDDPIPLPAEAATEDSRIGRYKLLEQIGEGGMGVVFMAEQEEPVRRKVANRILAGRQGHRRHQQVWRRRPLAGALLGRDCSGGSWRTTLGSRIAWGNDVIPLPAAG